MNAKKSLLPLLAAALLSVAAPATATDHGQKHGRDGKTHGHDSKTDDARIRIGFRIAPVPLRLHRRDRDLVGLGSYLVNAIGSCNECHTRPPFAPGGNPFAGEAEAINVDQYMAGGRTFGPVIKSTNLTPDEFGRPGGMDFATFEAAMRTGRASDGSNRILQVMPWPVLNKMSNRDLRAIYEYLRSIPSRPDNPSPGP